MAEFAEYVESLVGQFTEYLSIRDFDQIASLAHSLKGSGGSAGFPAFTDPALRLEQGARNEIYTECETALGEIRELSTRVEIPTAHLAEATIEETS